MPSTKSDAKVVQLPVRRRRRAAGIILGTAEHGDVTLDLDRLMRTRMLVTAASGGGKSYALRRLLEQTHHKVQQIVIDPEGELVTLADKFAYLVLSADSDETPMRADTAGELAQELWKSGHSAILCLDAMEIEEMQEFVANFLRGLMATRKQDWSPLQVVIDEGQIFAPQQEKSEAKRPTVDIAARGRKRGICPIIATQRVSQLSKGVCAQLQNQLIGLTTLDNDVERAAEMLGIKQNKAAETLRALESGEFLAYGPALGYDVRPMKIGPVQTRHGVLGQFANARRRPISRNKILNKVRKLGEAPAVDDAAAAASRPSTKDETRRKVADFRRWVIAPLLSGHAGHGAAAERSRQLGISQTEISAWYRSFKDGYNVATLEPKRLTSGMVSDMVRLSTLMLQETAHQRPGRNATLLKAA